MRDIELKEGEIGYAIYEGGQDSDSKLREE